jgi:imidazoleglycerol phosphate dehydratase HisB
MVNEGAHIAISGDIVMSSDPVEFGADHWHHFRIDWGRIDIPSSCMDLLDFLLSTVVVGDASWCIHITMIIGKNDHNIVEVFFKQWLFHRTNPN